MRKYFPILCLALLTFSCSKYQEYQPQFFNGHELVVIPDSLTDTHKKNVTQVLDYYNIEWKLEDDKIYLDSRIDNELMWNFTSKANDANWLQSHQPQ